MEEKLGNQRLELLRRKQRKELRELLSEENCNDIATELEILLEDEEISHEELLVIFRILPKLSLIHI